MSIKKLEWNCPNIAVPAVFNEAMGYTYQLAAFVENLNEVIDSVNTSETNVADMKQVIVNFESEINNTISEMQKDMDDYQSTLSSDFSAYKVQTNATIATKMDASEQKLQTQYNQFLADYQKQFGVVQTTGTSTTNVMSQKSITDEIGFIKNEAIYFNGVIETMAGGYSDLNAYDDGYYIILPTAGKPSNVPTGVGNGAFLVVIGDPDEEQSYKTQIYIDITTGKAYTRAYNGTSWTAWNS